MPPSRRDLIGGTAGAFSFLFAGCFATSGSDETPSQTPTVTDTPTLTTTPTETPTPTPSGTPIGGGHASPAPTCPDSDPLEPDWVVVGQGPLEGIYLELERQRIDFGDTLVATMTNVSDEEVVTGSRGDIDIQYRRDGGWHSIFGRRGNAVSSDLGFFHQPGAGFRWEFEFTRDGLTLEFEYEPSLYACSALEPGRYRFVFRGIGSGGSSRADDLEPAIGAPFSVSAD